MVGGVFVGQQADLLQRVEDQAVVAEADVVAVAFFEDARLDAVGPAVDEAVLDHVAGKFFADQDSGQKRHGVGHSNGYGIKERICLSVHRVGGNSRGGSDEGQHSVHEDAADGVSKAADAGGHSFAQDLGGLIPG